MRIPFLPDENVRYTTPGDTAMRELFVFAGGGALVVLWVAVIGAVYAKVFYFKKCAAQEEPKLSTTTAPVPAPTSNIINDARRKSRSNSLFKNVNPYSLVRYE